MKYRAGLPMWSLKSWQGSFFSQKARSADYLAEYASVFNTVEGNTTFYAIPSEASVQSWKEAVGDDFRFSFKLPKMITHDLKMQRCDLSVSRFFERLEPLLPQCGPFMIQLPPGFDGDALPVLEAFLRKLPASMHYAVEVRHLDFFDKADTEMALNTLLHKYNVDRVCFDSRGLFASTDGEAETLDAQSKKPRLPVHALALSNKPVVRFIGHTDLTQNDFYFENWLPKLAEWIAEGKEPYVFYHMADNTFAPQLALRLHQQLQESVDGLEPLPSWPVESALVNGQIGLF